MKPPIPGKRQPHRITLSSPHQNLPAKLKYRIPADLVRELGGFCRAAQVYKVSQWEEEASHDDDRQLLVTVKTRGPDGRIRYLKALVDTGAEANLVRTGLLSPSLFRRSRHPLSLVTADGKRMEGGKNKLL